MHGLDFLTSSGASGEIYIVNRCDSQLTNLGFGKWRIIEVVERKEKFDQDSNCYCKFVASSSSSFLPTHMDVCDGKKEALLLVLIHPYDTLAAELAVGLIYESPTT